MLDYSMLIHWTGEAFTVSFPEFPGHTTQGTSWQDAARNGEALLAQILESGEQPISRRCSRSEKLEEMRREIEEELRQAEDLWGKS